MWRWLAGGLVLVTLFVLVIMASPSGKFAAGALLSYVLDPGPPKIADGMSCEDWRGCGAAGRAINATLSRRFPLGSTAHALEAELSSQGFRRDDEVAFRACHQPGTPSPVGVPIIECPSWDPHWNPRNRLAYNWGHIPCGSTLSVMWSADRFGRLTHIDGSFGYACL